MSYARGRRFEHLIKDKLREAGFDARRVALSGRQTPGQMQDIPNTDLVVEERFRGKAKTTKAKKYVSFPEEEITELQRGEQDFLVFNFKRTQTFVVVRFSDFLDLLRMWKKRKEQPPCEEKH
jgi:Holliday junction resolvase